MEKLLDLGWKECSLDMAWEHYSKPIQKFRIWLHLSKHRNHNNWSFTISFWGCLWGDPCIDDFDVDFMVTVESVRTFEELLMEFEVIDLQKICNLTENQKLLQNNGTKRQKKK